MTVKTIKHSGGDYSTIQAWENATPANLVTAVDTWIGELYNDSEWVTTALTTIAGTTTDATHNVILRCATAQSFKSSSVSVALDYSQTNGVAWRQTTDNTGILDCTVNYTVVDGIQFKNDATTFDRHCVYFSGNTHDIVMSNCLGRGGGGSTERAVFVQSGASNQLFVNCLAICDRSDGLGWGIELASTKNYGGSMINCTVVKPSNLAAGGVGVKSTTTGGTDPIAKGCAVFGFTDSFNGTFNSASDYNGTDDSVTTGTGTHNQVSKTYANQFVSTTADWRLKASSDMEAHAVRYTETADLDIKGQARSTSTPDIGCWEFTASTTAVPIFVNNYYR